MGEGYAMKLPLVVLQCLNMNLLPAILIGGPPHSGKSVLAYSLTQHLRMRNVPHYLLRAAPDGEGDWSQQIARTALQTIRFKGEWTSHWVQVTCRDIAVRTLPLLVDVGGQPTAEQEVVFDQCTATILLTPNDQARNHWRTLTERHGLTILADLRSVPAGQTAIEVVNGVATGQFANIQRGTLLQGDGFEQLADQVAGLFSFLKDEIKRMHYSRAPTDAQLIDFDDLAQARYPHDEAHRFQRSDLESILDENVVDEPIAAYGRIPSWLACALGAYRNLVWQFDARMGWIQPPLLRSNQPGDTSTNTGLPVEVRANLASPDVTTVRVRLLADGYLDYSNAHQLKLPFIEPKMHVLVDGKMPLWLFAAIGQTYRSCASVTAAQPQQAAEHVKIA